MTSQPTPAPLRSRIRRWLVEGLVLLALLAAVGAWQARAVPSGQAPAFVLSQLNGEPMALTQLRGKPTLLAFWAPWCGVCRASSGNVSWLRAQLGERANVLSIASQYQSLAEVRAYVAEQGVDYPVLLDDQGTARNYGVRAYPTLVFLDAEGHIRHAAVGYTTGVGMYVRILSASLW